ncbi:MAG: glycerol-3-phosphate acyltransferase PlsY [Halanaerobium sp. 4-GBenrich]|jgi:glycerol-3-phosphate acyltransferase PlsY|uniref:Glycerol-3-phosphate acyltransferase n=1 Tax=Halanaerobium congolense TaxID=54121 RepID=A0A1G6HRI6_9FIRM|nr:glycerol-3-phosphate 1-O-acyltransferase PlsY [Halanaerobium congolense]KXS50051.1 MAG: glycerol-3-phosphate acyltransferase PlsY [Halanaerobium sp. T82-1]ODS49732.1 MAG: glycerol-3-phosphate acyltransferase PlsY [Halanaerobium sp. 4-GBenrich]PUU92942.1 MAG: glycerol-3-phosphate acyltransferase PlsY [Halanaerobium sp.]PTX16927.1 acyl-phosphate glycerol-3-phosphate acyltransferase [Halanaerobium congolense]PXV69910.1 acyl-phosphate glycerol-3-phosphate acyltransferase [Halanaerobium congolen
MRIFIAILISYLIGSIPSGFLLTKYVMKKDVRQYGSGNIGATNVARVMGLKSGILVAVFDILKGYLGVMVGQAILGDNLSTAILFVAIAAIAGHDWSIFLGFSGGKGVATTFGVILRLYPLAFLIYALIWLALVLTTRYVSLGSIIGSMSLPLTLYFTSFATKHVIFAALLWLFVMYTHRANIKRLLNGEENRMDPENLGKSGKK